MDWTTPLSEHPWIAVQWGTVCGFAAVATVWDLWKHRIPNELTGTCFAAGLIWAASVAGWAGFGDSLLGTLAAAFPFVLMFTFAGGGAGDAKLMGAIGAWVGLHGAVLALLAVMVAGGVMAVVWALMQGRLRAALSGFATLLITLAMRFVVRGGGAVPLPTVRQTHAMPYALAILLGVGAVSGWMVMR